MWTLSSRCGYEVLSGKWFYMEVKFSEHIKFCVDIESSFASMHVHQLLCGPQQSLCRDQDLSVWWSLVVSFTLQGK